MANVNYFCNHFWENTLIQIFKFHELIHFVHSIEHPLPLQAEYPGKTLPFGQVTMTIWCCMIDKLSPVFFLDFVWHFAVVHDDRPIKGKDKDNEKGILVFA